MTVLNKIKQVFKIKELRNSILFVLAMIFVFRLLAHIPLPGVDGEALKKFFDNNQLLGGMLNIFSGGGMEQFSVVMMGIGPYITASIILQLLTMIVPSLEELAKEPGGHDKINMYTRYLTVPMAALQSFSMIRLLQSSQAGVLGYLNFKQMLFIVITVTAGTMFLVWLGELINEKKIGNGISIMILAGIVAGIPSALQRIFATYDSEQLVNLIIFVAVALITIVAIVFITQGQRKIPVSYARQTGGGVISRGVNSHLPIPVNMAGMIPIIFAVSLVTFPPLIARFLLKVNSDIVVSTAKWVIDVLTPGSLVYGIIYFLMVVGFTYFYTFIVFHPDQMAENLQRQGGFIPGIRPGRHTQDYLEYVTSRILLTGSVFLGLIALLPIIIQQITDNPNLVMSGASLLIVVGVITEIVNKVDAQLTMRDYEGL